MALLALGVPMRVTLRGAEVPKWAGTLASVLLPVLGESRMVPVLARLRDHPDRARYVTLARLGGWVALEPLVRELL